MPATVIASFTLITLALVFYTLGVWAERVARDLKRWHVVAFWTGFHRYSLVVWCVWLVPYFGGMYLGIRGR